MLSLSWPQANLYFINSDPSHFQESSDSNVNTFHLCNNQEKCADGLIHTEVYTIFLKGLAMWNKMPGEANSYLKGIRILWWNFRLCRNSWEWTSIEVGKEYELGKKRDFFFFPLVIAHVYISLSIPFCLTHSTIREKIHKTQDL